MEQRPEATGEGQQTPFPSETDEDSLLREQKWGGGVQLMWESLGWESLCSDHSLHVLTLWQSKSTKKAPTLRLRDTGRKDLPKTEMEAEQQIIIPHSPSPTEQELRDKEQLFTVGRGRVWADTL